MTVSNSKTIMVWQGNTFNGGKFYLNAFLFIHFIHSFFLFMSQAFLHKQQQCCHAVSMFALYKHVSLKVC